jgi:hypothetical protein
MASGDLALNIAVSATDSASSILAQISKAVSDLAGSGGLGSIAAVAAGAAAAIVGVAAASTKMAGDFETGLTKLVTSAGEAQ